MITDFVSIACSKDVSRFNLTKPYRDLDRWVATDGHRMHTKDDYTVDKAFHLAGSDVEFPDYKMIITNKPSEMTANLKINRECVKQLKRFLKLAKLAASEKEVMTRVTTKDGHLVLTVKSAPDDWVQSDVSLKLSGEIQGDQVVGLNVQYLIEAIVGMYEEHGLYAIEVKADFRKKDVCVFEAGRLKAYIMPMRMND